MSSPGSTYPARPLTAPPDNAMFMSGTSNYASEYRLSQRVGPGKVPLFGKRQIFTIPSGGTGVAGRGPQIRLVEGSSPTDPAGRNARSVSPAYRPSYPLSVCETAQGPSGGSPPKPSVPYDITPPILIFRVYFTEDVTGSPLEVSRIRKLVLVYHTYDGSMQLLEPHQDNSGLEQGVFMSRQVVKKPDGGDYTPLDFNVGSEVTVLGRTLHIVDCDDATREYYSEEFGVDLPDRSEYPDSYTPSAATPTHNWGKQTKVYADPGFEEDGTLGFYRRKPDTKRQFLEHFPDTLNFECEWDDRASLYGDPRKLLLRIHLSDDTVDISEIFPRNSGRDEGFPRILTRQKLPLHLPSTDSSARAAVAAEARTGRPSTSHGLRAAAAGIDGKRPGTAPASSSPFSPSPSSTPKYLTPLDVTCGSRLPVFGKWLLVRRCCRHTRDWYAARGILQHFVEAPLPDVTVKSVERSPPPPHVGILAVGSEEDSAGNCDALAPKPSRPSHTKFTRLDGKVLRFTAHLVGPEDVDAVVESGRDPMSALMAAHPISPLYKDRRFIITYYMSDDSVSVYECAAPNSGLQPGKFLDRGKYRKVPAVSDKGTDKGTQQPNPLTRRLTQGHRFGYGDASVSRVAPSCVGVDSALGSVGTTLTGSPAPYFTASDFTIGGIIEFAHSPGQMFMLLDADEASKALMGLKQAAETVPASLYGALLPAQFTAFRKIAGLTKGCLASLCGILRRLEPYCTFDVIADPLSHPPTVKQRTLILLLARLGVCPPAISEDDINTALSTCTVDGTTDFNTFMRYLTAAGRVNTVDVPKYEAAFKQLQTAALSSVTHLRKMFRDLDTAHVGAITLGEMRLLLQRHNLDSGWSDGDVVGFMKKFPVADAAALAALGTETAISWRDFLLALIDAPTLSPKDVDTIVSLVSSTSGSLDTIGAGPVPGVTVYPPKHPHVPARFGPVPAQSDVNQTEDEDVVGRLRKFFGPRRHILLEAFRRFDSLGRGRLAPAGFLSALQSSGFPLSSSDRTALQDCLFPSMSKLPTIDYSLFLNTLLGDETE